MSYWSDQFRRRVNRIDRDTYQKLLPKKEDKRYDILRHSSDGEKRRVAFNVNVEEATKIIHNPRLLKKEWTSPGQLVLYTYTIEESL